jgi:nucleoid-associated protein YgaU
MMGVKMENREIEVTHESRELVPRLVNPNEEKQKEKPSYTKFEEEVHPRYGTFTDTEIEEESSFIQKNMRLLILLSTIIFGGYGLFSLLQKDEPPKLEKSESISASTPVSVSAPVASVPVRKEEIPAVDKNNKVFIPLEPLRKENNVVETQVEMSSNDITTSSVEEELKNINQMTVMSPSMPKIERIEPQEIKTKKVEVKKREVQKVKIVKRKQRKVKKIKQRVVVIKQGDTLASLAEKYYGNPMEFKPIIRANRELRNHKSTLRLGQKIVIPYLTGGKKRRFIIVRKGHTLASIAKRFYGDANKMQLIIDANYKIKDENSILRLGQKVYLPR